MPRHLAPAGGRAPAAMSCRERKPTNAATGWAAISALQSPVRAGKPRNPLRRTIPWYSDRRTAQKL